MLFYRAALHTSLLLPRYHLGVQTKHRDTPADRDQNKNEVQEAHRHIEEHSFPPLDRAHSAPHSKWKNKAAEKRRRWNNGKRARAFLSSLSHSYRSSFREEMPLSPRRRSSGVVREPRTQHPEYSTQAGLTAHQTASFARTSRPRPPKLARSSTRSDSKSIRTYGGPNTKDTMLPQAERSTLA